LIAAVYKLELFRLVFDNHFVEPLVFLRRRDGPIRMSNRRAAHVPAGMRIYAIGDLHGRADLLEQAFERIDKDLSAFPIEHSIEVFVGDYIDRGNASATVISHLIQRSSLREMVFLRGNHEVLLQEFLKNPTILRDWQQIGGLETLVSYGLQPPINSTRQQQVELAAALEQTMPQSHHEFFKTLRSSFVCGDYFFAHAGVRPGVPLSKQKEEDLFWIRNEFLDCTDTFEKVVVHGHTPVKEPEIYPNRINIDTGAYATGRLTCLSLEADQIHSI
jgi:serine/threonine protein phosphatase 1